MADAPEELDPTGEQLLEVLLATHRMQARDAEHVCRRCQRPVVHTQGRWQHLGYDGLWWVGCRAATWNGEQWADLPRHWRAEPEDR
jgi:uncharacterized protein with PIN domain